MEPSETTIPEETYIYNSTPYTDTPLVSAQEEDAAASLITSDLLTGTEEYTEAVTSVTPSADGELLQAVQSIDYNVSVLTGITIVMIAVFLSSVIIKTFFR